MWENGVYLMWEYGVESGKKPKHFSFSTVLFKTERRTVGGMEGQADGRTNIHKTKDRRTARRSNGWTQNLNYNRL